MYPLAHQRKANHRGHFGFPNNYSRCLYSSKSSHAQDLKGEPAVKLKSYTLQGQTTQESTASSSTRMNAKRKRQRTSPGVTVSTNTGHVLQTDLPKRMGGQDTAPQPVEMLLASWMGCTQATALFVARQLSVTIDYIEFDDIRAFRDEHGALELPIQQDPSVPSRLQRVTGTITVHFRTENAGTDGTFPVSDADFSLLKEQTELRCPVANMMIASGCQMDVEWRQASSGLQYK